MPSESYDWGGNERVEKTRVAVTGCAGMFGGKNRERRGAEPRADEEESIRGGRG